ncbi:MAG: hypothetical protein AB1792_07640 [Candidatus Zixiibacteriota bacterium]
MRRWKRTMLAFVVAALAHAPLFGAVPTTMTVQGKLTDAVGAPLPANSYPFTFAIFSVQAGGFAVWSEGQMVTTDAAGIWSAMMGAVTPIPASVFADSARWLEISVDPGKGPIVLPRVHLSTGPYSFRVATIDEATGGDIHGDVHLRSDLTVGEAGDDGNLFVTDAAGSNTLEIAGATGNINSVGDLQLVDALGGTNLVEVQSMTSGGRMHTYDELGQLTAAIGSASPSGGFVYVNREAGGGYGAYMDGEDGNSGHFYLYKAGGIINMEIDADDGDGASLLTLDDGAQLTVAIDAKDGADGGSRIRLYNSAGDFTGEWDADAGDDAGAFWLRDGVNNTVSIDAKDGADGGSRIRLYNSVGDYTGEWDADAGDDAGAFWLRDGFRNTVSIDAKDGTAGGSRIRLYNGAGLVTMELDADESDAGDLRLANEEGFNSVVIQAAEAVGNGAQIALYDSDSNATIVLDAEPGTGPGRVTTQVLEITGGADLAEQFTIHPSASGAPPVPGAVVCLDPAHPGDLVVSDAAYCRTVAGIISGAGGVIPGMLMRQDGSAADGTHPVALTGRVYVLANGPVAVGDLLTTSGTPGHAMRVVDHELARGAIIGKAMTALDSGSGLVLALVSLQ